MSEHELHPFEAEQAERGRALIHAAVAQTQAPLALRERLETARTRPAQRRRFALGGSLAGVMATAAAAILLASGGSAAGPSFAQAAELSRLGPTGAAPAVDSRDPRLLRQSVDGVTYPAWYKKFGWRASGVRKDHLHGRDAVTVYYESDAHVRIGYTIVGGGAIKEPAGPASVEHGERYVMLHRAGRSLVTWRRSGHTCILSGPGSLPGKRLVQLAAWTTPS
jgi:hypothetical protein